MRTNPCIARSCGRTAKREALAANRRDACTSHFAIRSRSRSAIAAARSTRTATRGARRATSRSCFSSTDAPANRASPAGSRCPSSASRDAPPSSAAVASIRGPTVPLLRARLAGAAALAVAYVALTMAVGAGMFESLDKQVLQAMSSVWNESLHPLFQGIAELGGLELTTILMIGLFVFLIRGGFGADAWVVLAFAASQALELLYKANLHHPGPPRTVMHADGPSLTELVSGSGPLANSFPSGHVVRALVAYGLIAFVVQRLAP